ncbi:WXG100 family type VII secretion target [Microbacterium sp. gxy059]|uniref:WXG100 family type VII secretion target n=1 Tax=Microbacterium sp. gxy059 TaxID=2957199 RepID=UPI003D9600F6
MTTFQVDTGHILAVSADVTASAERLRHEVAFLLGKVHALEGTWQGGASAGFQSLVAEWHALHSQVEHALESLTHRLTTAGTGYEMVEADMSRMFR